MHSRTTLPAQVGDAVLMGMAQLEHSAQMYIGAVLILDGDAPDPAEVADHLDQRLHRVPGLCHRYLAHRGRPRWQPKDVRAADHIAPAHVAADDTHDIKALVDAVRQRPPVHPAGAPMWDILIATGVRSGQWALIFRAHHSQMDGGAITHTLDHLFGDAQPAQPRPLWNKALRPALRKVPAAATALIRAARPTACWPAPAAVLRPGTPTYAVTEPVSVDRIKQPGATVTQVFAACFALAADSWWPLPGDRQVHAVVPMDLREPGEQRTLGNHFAPLRLALPTGRPNRVLREVTDQMSAWQRPGFRAGLDVTLSRVTPFPITIALGTRIAAGSRCRAVVSSVRSKNPLSYRGSPVVDLIPIAPTFPGHALCAVLWTYQNRARVIFTSHTAMPPVDALPQAWEQALKAIEAELP